MRILALLALTLGLSNAQDNSTSKGFTDFSGGLNTYRSPVYLQDNESPDLLNVILDKTGAVTKREGISKRNTTALGDGASDVNAVWQLEQSNGSKFCVAFSSTNGYLSTDACQTFTSFITTMTRNNDVTCDPLNDKLYCVNNQYNMQFNGSDDASFGGPSNLKILRIHRNRCFGVAAATPSRLQWSALGDCTSWGSTDYVDVQPEDGDILNAIGEPLYDMLPICKKFSYWALKGNTPATFQLINISRNTGCLGQRSTANFNNKQYFDSVGPNGGRPGIYEFNGIVIEEASKKLRGEIDTLDTFKANAGFRSIDSYADWSAGSFSSMALSASRESGYMQSSYTTFTDTLGTDFGAGTKVNVSTVVVSGSVTVSPPSSPTFTNAGAEGSSNTNWNMQEFARNTASPVPYGSSAWSINGDETIGDGGIIHFDILDTSSNTILGYPVIVSGNMAVTEYTINVATLPYAQIILHVWADINSGRKEAYSVPFLRPESIKVKVSDFDGASEVRVKWDLWEPASYITSGTFTSRVFDMAISTPIWGLWTANVTSNTHSGLSFQTQVATSSSGDWDSAATATAGTELGSASKRYLRYLGNYTIASATNVPAQLNSATVSAASTGAWRSQELFLSNNMSSWGTFQAVETKSGSECSITYGIKSSTFSGGTASTYTFTPITSGATPNLSTGAYVVIIATYTTGVATETCKTDLITVNWGEGSQARSASMKVYNGRLHYAAQSEGANRNDVMYVLDSNGAWSKWSGISARHLNIVNTNFVAGGSTTTGGGFIYKLYDSDSDDGVPINAYWESHDLPLNSIANIKAVDRIYTIHTANNSSLRLSLKADGGLRTFNDTISLSTGAAFGIRPTNVIPAINGNTFRLRFGNNAASAPWEVLGWLFYYRDLGLMRP